jgi:outer membrane protein OmpA-like peptidoglycan-associated protein
MKTYLLKTALFAAVAAGGLSLAACAGPIWPASVGQLHDHVEGEHNRAVAAEAATNEKVASVDQVAHDAVARADAAAASAKHPFTYAVLMQDDSIVFKTNSSALSDEAQKRLTEIADKLKSENQNVYIEIQGHGDTRGSKAHNNALGERRAAAVREYLATQGVPRPRMTTVSYGEEKPANAEQTDAAHAQNRRVVLVVMG